jgi:hypothetical protein
VTRREGCEEKGARGEEPLTVSFIPRSTTVLVGSDATVMVPALPKVVSVGRLPVENGDAPCHCSAHWYNYLLVCVVEDQRSGWVWGADKRGGEAEEVRQILFGNGYRHEHTAHIYTGCTEVCIENAMKRGDSDVIGQGRVLDRIQKNVWSRSKREGDRRVPRWLLHTETSVGQEMARWWCGGGKDPPRVLIGCL